MGTLCKTKDTKTNFTTGVKMLIYVTEAKYLHDYKIELTFMAIHQTLSNKKYNKS